MRLGIFFFPLIMDLTVGALFFLIPIQVRTAGGTDTDVGLIFAAFSLAYIITNFILAKAVHARNAVHTIIGTQIALVIAGLGVVHSSSLLHLACAVVGFGIFCAAFFYSFQLAMGEVTGLSPAATAAVYTFAWSTGMALGSIVMGLLVGSGVKLFLVPVALSATSVIVGMLLVLRHRRLHPEAAQVHAEAGGIPPLVGAEKRFVRLGWLGICAVSTVAFGVRGLLPKSGIEQLGLELIPIALMLSLGAACQAVTGLCWQRGQRWLFRRLPPLVAGILGAGGLALMWAQPRSPAAIYLGFAVLGVCMGTTFFHAVYYSLRSGPRAIAVNEVLVGTGAIVGGPLCGMVSEQLGMPRLFGIGAIAMLLLFLAAVAVVGPPERMAGDASDKPATDGRNA
jgi:MFS family permease